MIKKYLIIFCISFLFNNISFGVEISDSTTTTEEPKGPTKSSNIKLAVKSINRGDKYEKKGKNEKAVKHYKKAFKLLLASNKEYPSETDTLAYLGYTNKKLGNFEDAEIYYLMGLEIAPNHFKINKYLGELYLDSNKIVLAKERLEILKNCNCREFKELDNLIKLTASK